ncbi:MAG: hypothetical protein OXG88_03365 [Gammaproteobacteria bacterium]|nr:hypothetical protein [Gammaproteobacteria bacterium]
MMESSEASTTRMLDHRADKRNRLWVLFATALGTGLGLIGYAVVVALTGFDLSGNNNLTFTTTDTISESTPQHDALLDLQNLGAETAGLSEAEVVSHIDTLSLDQLIAFVDEITKSKSSAILTVGQLFLMGKLVQQDPRVGLELVWKFPRHTWSDLVDVVFSEWSLVDLREAIAASKKLGNALRDTALRSIIATRTEVTNENWMALANEHELDVTIRKLVSEKDVKNMLDSPIEVVRILREDNVPYYLQYDLKKKFARAAFQRHGMSAFEPIAELLAENAERVNLYFMNEDNSVQLIEVADRLPDLPYGLRFKVVLGLIDAWVVDSPDTAYEELSTFADFRQRFWSHIAFDKWAEVDVEGLLERIESFPRYERGWAAEVGIIELAKKSPADAALRMAELENILGVNVSRLQKQLLYYWQQEDPTETLQWITENTEAGSQNQANLLASFLSSLAEEDPAGALEIALSQAPTSAYAEQGSVSGIIEHLTETGEFELAMSALDRVPDAARLGSYTAVGKVLVEKEQWHEALDLVAEFSHEDKYQYFVGLTLWAARNDLDKMLDTIPGLPSENRWLVAHAALANAKYYGSLMTEKQIEYLEQYSSR